MNERYDRQDQITPSNGVYLVSKEETKILKGTGLLEQQKRRERSYIHKARKRLKRKPKIPSLKKL